jgi:hypothetical protein
MKQLKRIVGEISRVIPAQVKVAPLITGDLPSPGGRLRTRTVSGWDTRVAIECVILKLVIFLV